MRVLQLLETRTSGHPGCLNKRSTGATTCTPASSRGFCAQECFRRPEKSGSRSFRAHASQDPRGPVGGKPLFGWLSDLSAKAKEAASQLDSWAEDETSPEVAALATGSGWDVQLSVYEREPNEPLSTKVANRVNRVDLGLEVSFLAPDPGFYPPRGEAVVTQSRFFEGGKGAFWIVDEEGYFKFTLNVKEVKAGELVVIPKGRVYFNGKVQYDANTTDGSAQVCLRDGVATIKQDVKASFLGQDYSGILAEYVIIGTFLARPALDAA
ncbi:hypothetical protein CYMTET_31001 [Cymbomonas tetramitiformis]|uniref:Uncharacterized protein n=1 Tax=Cymbomonas tetramitiformis TaxID=36881 RepID=A0AAE0KTB9_9CHLO|nr:hypothetical protein CYMTET_31001 [Cymbomonas tetramitiformis]